MSKLPIFDVIGFLGAAFVTWGISLIYFPAAPIFGGLLLLFVGIFGSGFRLKR